MSVADTAASVLDWAATRSSSDRGDGAALSPAPHGDLEQPHGLADPPGHTVRALRALAAVSAARLRCDGTPPLGLDGALGPGAALLAAAIGARHRPDAVELLLRAVPRARSGWDHVARYGLLEAAQAAAYRLDGDPRLVKILPALRAHAPLAGVLDAPGTLDAMACRQLATALLAKPEGRAAVHSALAEPCLTDDQAQWRGQLLEQCRLTNRDFVLDVYQTALTLHRPEHAARRLLAERSWLAAGPTRTVLATARWWNALAYLERRQRSLVRAQLNPYNGGWDLERDYLRGVRLYWSVAEATGEGR